MVCEVAELRYSFNGITDSQITTLFNKIEQENSQFIIKRISNPKHSLSADDVIIEGIFSPEFLSILARTFPPPLSCKIQIDDNISQNIINYSTFTWSLDSMLFVGVTTLPIVEIKNYIGFESSNHFMNLITSTRAGSFLKSLLVVKPKGLISIDKNVATLILPNHRIDLIIEWLKRAGDNTVDLNWLSGSTGELETELVNSIGFVDQNVLAEIDDWLGRAKVIPSVDFNIVFKRALACLT